MSGQEKTKMTSAAHRKEIAIPDVANQRWKSYLKEKGAGITVKTAPAKNTVQQSALG